jgi:hypothetical protein
MEVLGMGERLCYECTKPMDFDADICPSCGASQKEYEKSFFSLPLVKNGLALFGSIIFAALLRAINPAIAAFFVLILLIVIIAKKSRSKGEKIEKPYDGTGLNLKD